MMIKNEKNCAKNEISGGSIISPSTIFRKITSLTRFLLSIKLHFPYQLIIVFTKPVENIFHNGTSFGIQHTDFQYAFNIF